MISADVIDGTPVEAPPPEIMPRTAYLSYLEERYTRTGFSYDFPVLTDLDVKRAGGSRGTSFAPQIKTATFWNPQEQKLVGVAYFSLATEGPINCAHGGSIATCLDNIFGTLSLRVLGFGAYTLQLNVSYRKFVPLETVVKFEAWQTEQTGQKVFSTARLLSLDDDSVHAEATALFYRPQESLSFEDAQRLFGRESGITKEELIRMRLERRDAQRATESSSKSVGPLKPKL
jgi:hypothetical protein